MSDAERQQRDDASLKEALREEMKRRNMSQSKLSKESGVGSTRLSLWFSGRYSGDNQAVADELQRWLMSAQEQSNDTRTLCAVPDWEPTPTAKNIVNVLKYAQRAGDMALVYGGAGVGKTCTARYYQDSYPNVWLATMSPAMNTVAACLERVAFAVGIPEAQPSAIKTENAIVGRIAQTSGLLIVDEAQHLPVSSLEAIRSVYDATGVGVALMGNESVYTRITGGSRQAHFAQLFSRVGYRVKLGSPTAGDVDALLASWQIKGRKSHELCKAIAQQAGALRGLTKVLKMGSMMTEDGQSMTFDHIQTAWADLGGTL